MSTATVMALALWASTTTAWVPSKDGLIQVGVPQGYSEFRPAPHEGDVELRDAAGDSLSVRPIAESSRISLEAAVYDEAKALEMRLAGGKDCLAGPLQDLSLGSGRAARGLNGRCGSGPEARDYGVLISTTAGQTLLASATGRLDLLVGLITSVRADSVPIAFSPPLQGPPGPLAPLPPRPFHGRYALALMGAFAAIQIGALALRPFIKKRSVEAPPAVPSIFPLLIERRHFRSEVIFDITGGSGANFTAFSDRRVSIIMAWGAGLLCVCALQALFHADRSVVMETLVFACLALGIGAILQRLSPRKVTLFDGEDNLQLRIVEEGFSPIDPRASALDPDGWEVFRLRRRREGRLRRWELVEPLQGQVIAELAERDSFRSWLRPFTGHLWGLLRTEYAVLLKGQEAGALRRESAIGNKLRLDMAQTPGLDYRFVLAAALFIERVDPDRWHPWPA